MHPGQGTRNGTYPEQGMNSAPWPGYEYSTYPDMGILLFPGQDDFLLFIIFWLIILCTLTHKCSLPRVPCIPYIPCPGFHGYPAQGSTHTLPCVLRIPYPGFHAHPAHGTTQAYLSHSTPKVGMQTLPRLSAVKLTQLQMKGVAKCKL